MSDDNDHLLRPLLAKAFGWVNQLRWVAGSLIIAAGVIQPIVEGWPRYWIGMVCLGAAVLLANGLFLAIHRRMDWTLVGKRHTLLLAWCELLFDLVVLTLLTFWTGGPRSPLLGLYVLHMIFASLIMPRGHAYGIALVAAGIFALGQWWWAQWPSTFQERAFVVGFVATLQLAVFLSNRLTRALFQIEHARRKDRKRNKVMRRKLRAQQRAMVQHEKLVSMGKLTAGVAHEIANPLASMDALLQVLQRKPERFNESTVNDLRKQVRRIQTTVRTLTGIAHPDLGERSTANLNDVVHSTLETLRYDHRMRRVKVDLQLAVDLPAAPMVTRAIAQVLTNLILNALDELADHTAPVLQIRTTAEDGWVIVRVEDNGPGFPADQRDRIFKPFVTTKRIGKGTGLGLPISLALVREHGGDLTAESEPGIRTSFIVRLPQAEHHSAPPAPPDECT